MIQPERHPPEAFPASAAPAEVGAEVAVRLKDALAQGAIPTQYLTWAQRLLKRLETPVQLVVIGPRRSGKSALIDMLMGQSIIGSSPAAGLIEIAYGHDARAEIHRANAGAPQPVVTTHEGLLSDHVTADHAASGPSPLRLRQSLPDSRLRKFNVAEISLSGSADEQAAILEQAAQFADVMIWCSPVFTPQEQGLWSNVPEQRKDHAFLVLSMADQLIMRDRLSEQMESLADVAAEDFLGLYPVAAIQGLNAQRGGTGQPGHPPGLNRPLWHQSGGKRLYEDVMQQIELGRTADIDQALAVLAQSDTRLPATPTPVRPKAPANPPCPPARPSDPLAAAAALITRQAQELSTAGETANVDHVLKSALGCVRSLIAQLGQAGDQNPQIRAAQDAAQDSEEVLMLCQLEQNEEAATDAVTLLLQLKRELQPQEGRL